MNVLALTIFVGAILVILFTMLWFLQAISPHTLSEREALMPLEDDARPQAPSELTSVD